MQVGVGRFTTGRTYGGGYGRGRRGGSSRGRRALEEVPFRPLAVDCASGPLEAGDSHLPLSVGEITVTLQDVACLLGLPLAGDAIGPSKAAADWHVDLAQRFNHVLPGGVHPDDVRWAEQDRPGPRAQWLRQFEVIKLLYFLFFYLLWSL